MWFGIQRRNIYLTPPVGMDRLWVVQQLQAPQIKEMFGLEPGTARDVRAATAQGQLIMGIIRRAETRKRIGFVGMRAPWRDDAWEFSYAIPDPAERDAYAALHTMDLVAHYMLDHVRASAVGGWTRVDNHAAEAVARRAGHVRVGQAGYNGFEWNIYRLEPAGWAARKARLERGEAAHPSGIGGIFATLPQPPYAPVVPVTAA